MITLATAHPAKFAEAITKAGMRTPTLPPHLHDLFEREESYTVVKNSLSAVTDFVSSRART
jgi:threonine synthase